MPTLPIPVFGALVLLFLFLRFWAAHKRVTPIAALLLICAAQAIVLSLAQHYLVPGMRLVQPISATLIPPMAWLAYQTSAVRPPRASDWLHALVPLTALAALLVAPDFLNLFIPAVFLGYGIAIIAQSLKGPDAQPQTNLESGELPGRIWLVIGLALIASAFSDVLIAVAHASDAAHLQPWIISLFSTGNLLLIGGLCLSGHLQVHSEAQEASDLPVAPPDGEVWEKVQAYMAERRPYLDPDLTLSKFSRKMGIPAKTLSITINRATGGNVSRYVNDARIAAAQTAMLAGENVTNAMLSSGFNTKSNFNREFLRVTQSSPSKWLAEHAAVPDAA